MQAIPQQLMQGAAAKFKLARTTLHDRDVAGWADTAFEDLRACALTCTAASALPTSIVRTKALLKEASSDLGDAAGVFKTIPRSMPPPAAAAMTADAKTTVLSTFDCVSDLLRRFDIASLTSTTDLRVAVWAYFATSMTLYAAKYLHAAATLTYASSRARPAHGALLLAAAARLDDVDIAFSLASLSFYELSLASIPIFPASCGAIDMNAAVFLVAQSSAALLLGRVSLNASGPFVVPLVAADQTACRNLVSLLRGLATDRSLKAAIGFLDLAAQDLSLRYAIDMTADVPHSDADLKRVEIGGENVDPSRTSWRGQSVIDSFKLPRNVVAHRHLLRVDWSPAVAGRPRHLVCTFLNKQYAEMCDRPTGSRDAWAIPAPAAGSAESDMQNFSLYATVRDLAWGVVLGCQTLDVEYMNILQLP